MHASGAAVAARPRRIGCCPERDAALGRRLQSFRIIKQAASKQVSTETEGCVETG